MSPGRSTWNGIGPVVPLCSPSHGVAWPISMGARLLGSSSTRMAQITSTRIRWLFDSCSRMEKIRSELETLYRERYAQFVAIPSQHPPGTNSSSGSPRPARSKYSRRPSSSAYGMVAPFSQHRS